MAHDKFYGICDNKCFVEINADSVGAAAKSHTHSADNITAGILPVERGGTGGGTTTELRTNLNVLQMVQLYSNGNGTTGTVTLSDSVHNYKYIEIFYRSGNYFYDSVRIAFGDAQKVSSLSIVNPTSGFVYIDARTIIINGTSITNGDTGHCGIENGSNYSNSGNSIYINRVIGYKF